MLEKLFLDLSIPGWIALIIALLLGGLSGFYYRKTLPPLTSGKQIFLTILRSLSLVIVFFLLLQPVFSFFKIGERPAGVAFVVDNSKSMKNHLDEKDYLDSLQAFLKQMPAALSEKGMSANQYLFSDSLYQLSGRDAEFDGEKTNLAFALQMLADQINAKNIHHIFLLTDGQFNEGANPLEISRDLGTPLSFVQLGTQKTKQDIVLADLQFKPVTYVNDVVEISAIIKQQGFNRQSVTVQFFAGKKLIGSKRVNLPKRGFEKEVKISHKFSTAADVRLRAKIVPQSEELNLANNSKSNFIRILKNKVRVLVISGKPSFDQKILLHTLKNSSRVIVENRTEQNNGRFFADNSPVQFDSTDVFILLNYPTVNSRANIVNNIQQQVLQNKKALFVIAGRYTDFRKLSKLSKNLPVEIPRRNSKINKYVPELSAAGAIHPACRIDEFPEINRRIWSDLPPVFSRVLIQKKTANQLLAAESQHQLSLLTAQVTQGQKSLLLNAEGFYQWQMQLQRTDEKSLFFATFLDKSLQWLTSREDLEKIRIAPQKQQYLMGENIRFSGSILGEQFEMLVDAAVSIKIEGDSVALVDEFAWTGNTYIYDIQTLGPGNYKYSIEARRNDILAGEKRGKFNIAALDLESAAPEMNYPLLETMSKNSGGKIYTYRQMQAFLNQINIEPQIQSRTEEYVLWIKLHWLIVVVGLLSLEWAMRKRWGLL